MPIDAANAQPHVLVVDDEEPIRRIVETWLTRFGYPCTTCADGLEALLLMDREPFGIVIMDWHMPGMDGIELVRLLRARSFSKVPYLVLTTGDPDRGAMEKAFLAGANDFIRKPIDPPELLARLHAARRVLELEEKVGARMQEQALMGLHRGVVRELSEVVRTLAHDLRTPLATLRMTAESLRGKVDADHPDLVAPVERLCRVSEGMSETLEDVVTAFVADDHADSSWSVFDLSAEIRRAVEMVSGNPQASRIAFHLPQTPFRFKGNPYSIRRLVMNLASNSIRHAQCRSVRISLDCHGENDAWTLFDLQDDGAGIPPDLLPHLGEPMYLSDAAHRKEFFVKGSGLGFVICRRVVAEHGGRMLVSSAMGRGVRVRIWFPADNHGPVEDSEFAPLETEVVQ